MDPHTGAILALGIGALALLFGVGALWRYGLEESKVKVMSGYRSPFNPSYQSPDRRAWDDAVALARSADLRRRTEGRPVVTADAFLVPEPNDPPEFELPAWVNDG